MKYYFALLLQKHEKFGLLIHPFILSDEGKPYYNVEARLSIDQIDDYEHLFDDIHRKIIQATENYSDKSIAKRFSNNKYNAREFLKKVADDYVEKYIRPYIEKQLITIIDLAKKRGIFLYLRETKNVIYKNQWIKIEEEPAEVVFNFHKHSDHTRYFQTIIHKGSTIVPLNKNGIVLANDPCLLLLDNRLYHFRHQVDGKKLAAFFDKEYINVPQKHEKKYYTTFIKKCIRDYTVLNQGFEIRRTARSMQAIISIEEDFEGLPGLVLTFDYGEGQIIVPGTKQSKQVKVIEYDGNYAYEVFERDTQKENKLMGILINLGLIKIFENIYRLPDNRNQYSLINWLNEHSENLKESGFQLVQNFYEVKFFTETLKADVQFEPKNDWFDVRALAHFGNDYAIPFYELRHYIINNIREYRLPDGRVAILPEIWFSRYTDLVTFGRKAKEKIRVENFHAGLIKQATTRFEVVSQKSEELNEPSLKIWKPEVPQLVKANLRSYQVDGFHWMANLRKKLFGGCLADDMGLGKTLQTLTLLAHHIQNGNGRKNQSNAVSKIAQYDLFSEPEQKAFNTKPSLVIMPASLIHNWQNEIRKFTPHLHHINYTGTQRTEHLQRFPNTNLVLTTYGTIRNDFEELEKFEFDYIILDESQVIKNPLSKTARAIYRLRGEHRLALSGTPIENSLTDLWSQMHFLNPGLLRDLKFFKSYFGTPIEKNDDEEKRKKLQLLIRPFILRRTKKQVEKELPELSEEFVYCEMTMEQSEFYNDEKIKVRNYILESIEKMGINKSSIILLQALTKLRQIAGHPLMVDQNYKDGSGKFKEVIRTLEAILSEGHKVLVFSPFVKHLRIFADYFDSQKIKYALLTGQSQNREKIINEFQNEHERNVFLLSLKAGGIGLNLTEAEYVFMLDPWWNPQVENQAVNRAHRIGQSRHVFVYRFITLATIEEKIISLQRKKSSLAELFIKTDNPVKSMNMEQINQLIN